MGIVFNRKISLSFNTDRMAQKSLKFRAQRKKR